jgi:hypothetical protein
MIRFASASPAAMVLNLLFQERNRRKKRSKRTTINRWKKNTIWKKVQSTLVQYSRQLAVYNETHALLPNCFD